MAIVKKYRAKVEEIFNPLPDIYSVSFTSEKEFKYLPGQFLHLALDDYDGIGQWPESRCFSMQSSPNAEIIKITFAVKGSFTKRMIKELHAGKKIWLKLPYGDIFERGHSKINCVFIAGGTGITPFLSLFNCNSFSGYISPKLYFGVRKNNYNIFKSELFIANKINSSFYINIIEQDKNGVLDIEKIYKNNPGSVYFMSGPPVMIKNFKNYLLGRNIPSTNILTDDWE
jgi:predicted ferric reductase